MAYLLQAVFLYGGRKRLSRRIDSAAVKDGGLDAGVALGRHQQRLKAAAGIARGRRTVHVHASVELAPLPEILSLKPVQGLFEIREPANGQHYVPARSLLRQQFVVARLLRASSVPKEHYGQRALNGRNAFQVLRIIKIIPRNCFL